MNYDHLLSNGTTGINPSYEPAPKHHACPNCGACPHCGRGGWQTQPYNPYPTYPNWFYPTWEGPFYKVTC